MPVSKKNSGDDSYTTCTSRTRLLGENPRTFGPCLRVWAKNSLSAHLPARTTFLGANIPSQSISRIFNLSKFLPNPIKSHSSDFCRAKSAGLESKLFLVNLFIVISSVDDLTGKYSQNILLSAPTQILLLISLRSRAAGTSSLPWLICLDLPVSRFWFLLSSSPEQTQSWSSGSLASLASLVCKTHSSVAYWLIQD